MNDFRNFLIDISNSPEMKNNKVAWTIAKYPNINKTNREVFYESLMPLYPFSEDVLKPIEKVFDEIIDKNIKSYQNKDFRIKRITGSNFRCFPNSIKPYGIDFCKDDITHGRVPKSMII